MKVVLDTSVVVRYLTNDPPDLAAVSAEHIDSHEELYVTDVTLLEASFALERLYSIPRAEVVETLIRFLSKASIRVLHLDKDIVIDGLELCRPSRRVSFGDALIWAAVRADGDAMILSFDQRFPDASIEVRNLF